MKRKEGIAKIALILATILLISACAKKSNSNKEQVVDVDTQSQLAPATDFPTGHKSDTVKIGYVDVTGGGVLSDTLGVARDQGFIEEELNAIGVKVELVPMTGAGPAINEALATKDLDIGVLGDVPAVIGKASGIDTQIIAYSGLNNGASLVVGDETYHSVQDLKGKKIATQRGAFMHRILQYMLSDVGMKESDIEFVNANAQDSAELLVTGNVDAAVVGGVTLTRLVEQGYKVVCDYREHPEWSSGSYIVARTEYIEKNPDIILAFIRALVKARNLCEEEKDTIRNQWLSTGESEESYRYLYPDGDNYYSIGSSEADIQNKENTLKFLLDNKLIVESFDIETWENATFYTEAFKELSKK
ncbi:ABC transporter substrate-binding protein [Anaerosporobacter sp.]|uniref:ABC transporter substrate-binding protein n=1 Tax=Anaerosporobacter sp. TaxID=1872529 RepID=UPI00286EC46D|nr:ABC transporter substrate-binding protein [Anaerosporobacter sp.]